MIHIVLTLAAAAIVALAATSAMAGNERRSCSGYVEYHGYHQ